MTKFKVGDRVRSIITNSGVNPKFAYGTSHVIEEMEDDESFPYFIDGVPFRDEELQLDLTWDTPLAKALREEE